MKFKIGDKISFLNEKASGVITRIISNHQVVVSDESGFEIPVSINEIVPLTDKTRYTTDARMISKRTGEEKTPVVPGHPPKFPSSGGEVWEVDLHFNELFDMSSGYAGAGKNISGHEKLMYQIRHFRKCMDAAIAHRIKKIIFIHGAGKGTLREEIIRTLKNYEGATCYDAPYSKYGQGALIVEVLSY